ALRVDTGGSEDHTVGFICREDDRSLQAEAGGGSRGKSEEAEKCAEVGKRGRQSLAGCRRYSFKSFKYFRRSSPKSGRLRANSIVAFRKPSLSPVSWRLPS